jgi:gas vesicle structural protein
MPKPSTAIILDNDDINDESTLLDVLDHLLNSGVVISGNLTISLAGVDLIYIRLDVILTSVETAVRHMQKSLYPRAEPNRIG